LHDRAGGVRLVGPLVEDVGFVAGLVADVAAILAAEEHAAVGVVARPELHADREVAVRVLGEEVALSLPPALASMAPSFADQLASPTRVKLSSPACRR
jgi:hypothetical protein